MLKRRTVAGIDHLPLQTIRAAALGRDPSVPRTLAVAALAVSAYPNRRRDLESLVQNADETPELRALAADRLGRIEHPATPATLLRLLDHPVATVRRQLIRRLGLLGDEPAIPALLALSERESGPARSRARFAAALIAHRFQHEARVIDLPPHSSGSGLSRGELAATRIDRPSPADIAACITDLASEPSGIDYGERSAIRIRIEGEQWMVLINADFEHSNAASRLEHRCTVLGVVAEWHGIRERYFLTGLVLSSPACGSDPPRLHLHELDGMLLGFGDFSRARDGYAFALGTVTDAIGLAIEVTGTLGDGGAVVDTMRAAEISTRKRMVDPLPARAT